MKEEHVLQIRRCTRLGVGEWEPLFAFDLALLLLLLLVGCWTESNTRARAIPSKSCQHLAILHGDDIDCIRIRICVGIEVRPQAPHGRLLELNI